MVHQTNKAPRRKLTGIASKEIKESLPFAYRYFEQTNEILGMVGFATAFACISTENPVLYAWIALLFIILAWGNSYRQFQHRLDLLSIARVSQMKKWEIAKRCKIGLAGACVLFAVATGFFDKYGLNLDPMSGKIKLRSSPAVDGTTKN